MIDGAGGRAISRVRGLCREGGGGGGWLGRVGWGCSERGC